MALEIQIASRSAATPSKCGELLKRQATKLLPKGSGGRAKTPGMVIMLTMYNGRSASEPLPPVKTATGKVQRLDGGG